jgi:hypothetical protein
VTLTAAMLSEFQAALATYQSSNPMPAAVASSAFAADFTTGQKRAVLRSMADSRITTAKAAPTVQLAAEVTLIHHILLFGDLP